MSFFFRARLAHCLFPASEAVPEIFVWKYALSFTILYCFGLIWSLNYFTMDRIVGLRIPNHQDNLKSIDKDSEQVLCRIFYSSFSNVISFEGKKKKTNQHSTESQEQRINLILPSGENEAGFEDFIAYSKHPENSNRLSQNPFLSFLLDTQIVISG